jgi:hypothetical protein
MKIRKVVSVISLICILCSFAAPAVAADSAETVEQVIKAIGIMLGDQNGNMNPGKEVTRAEFAKMLCMASAYKDGSFENAAVSRFKDVKYTHWAAEYIRIAVDEGWLAGYLDGTFRPDAGLLYEEAANAVIKLLGYTNQDIYGTFPNAQISKFKALKLDSGISAVKGGKLTRKDCMNIFYNLMGAADKAGTVYAVKLGYPVGSDGKIDYFELVQSETKGPFICTAANWASSLPFDAKKAVFYRNGKQCEQENITLYDVYYYNEKEAAVWAYSDRAVGIITAVSPNTASPASVTIAGVQYALGASDAKRKLSAAGEFSAGDAAAALLGMNGEVVDIVPASLIDSAYYGVVTASSTETYSTGASQSKTSFVIKVACTDGTVREFVCPGDMYAAGALVSASYKDGELKIKSLSSKSISGQVSADGKKLGSYTIAADAEILDVTKDGKYVTVTPGRLAGSALAEGAVRFFMLNEAGEISHLVLNDVTGDLHTYGILTEVSEKTSVNAEGFPSYSGTYKYVINGAAGMTGTSTTLYYAQEGPAIFYYKDGAISRISSLTPVSLSDVGTLSAAGENRTYAISKDVQVYLRSGSSYYLTELSAVSNTDEYTVYGYYESGYAAGGLLRVITAVKR